MWEIRPGRMKWFKDATPSNYVPNAVVSIGSGANGTVTVTHDKMETDDQIRVVVAASANASLSAAYATKVITVTLGTDANGDAASAKNTATLIATALNGIANKQWTAAASGTGASSIDAAVNVKDFEDGQYGTPCPIAYLGVEINGTVYVCEEANNSRYNDGWKQVTLTALT